MGGKRIEGPFFARNIASPGASEVWEVFQQLEHTSVELRPRCIYPEKKMAVQKARRLNKRWREEHGQDAGDEDEDEETAS